MRFDSLGAQVKNLSWMKYTFHHLSNLLFWLLVPTLIIIVGGIPLLIWLANSKQGLDIVEQGDGVNAIVKEELEEGWAEAVDVNTGGVYYFNNNTRAVCWEKPVQKKIVIIGTKEEEEEEERLGEKKIEEQEAAFNDALYSVAHERVREIELNGGIVGDRASMTHDIANKLRRRYYSRNVNGGHKVD